MQCSVTYLELGGVPMTCDVEVSWNGSKDNIEAISNGSGREYRDKVEVAGQECSATSPLTDYV